MKFGEKNLFIHDGLSGKLDLMCDRITKHDFDNLLILDGDEGHGKSTLAVQIGCYISHVTGRPFSVDNVFFDLDELLKFSGNQKEQIILWDESALGGLSTEGFNKLQVKLLKLLMIARKKNHFYIFVIPKFYRLREAIVDRAIGIIHVYARNEIERGRFAYYKKKNKEYLYEYWRRTRQKGYKKFLNFQGTFTKMFGELIDSKEYDRKKDQAIKEMVGTDDKKEEDLSKLRLLQQSITKIPLPQKEIAKILGVTPRTMRNWSKLHIIEPQEEEEGGK